MAKCDPISMTEVVSWLVSQLVKDVPQARHRASKLRVRAHVTGPKTAWQSFFRSRSRPSASGALRLHLVISNAYLSFGNGKNSLAGRVMQFKVRAAVLADPEL